MGVTTAFGHSERSEESSLPVGRQAKRTKTKFRFLDPSFHSG